MYYKGIKRKVGTYIYRYRKAPEKQTSLGSPEKEKKMEKRGEKDKEKRENLSFLILNLFPNLLQKRVDLSSSGRIVLGNELKKESGDTKENGERRVSATPFLPFFQEQEKEIEEYKYRSYRKEKEKESSSVGGEKGIVFPFPVRSIKRKGETSMQKRLYSGAAKLQEESTLSLTLDSMEQIQSTMSNAARTRSIESSKHSTRREELIEYRKIRSLYGGLSSREFKKSVCKAKTFSGNVADNLLLVLESRLDVALQRSAFFARIQSARQSIVHGRVKVNKKSVRTPGYLLQAGDLLQVQAIGEMFSRERFSNPHTQCAFEFAFPFEKEEFPKSAKGRAHKEKAQANPQAGVEDRQEYDRSNRDWDAKAYKKEVSSLTDTDVISLQEIKEKQEKEKGESAKFTDFKEQKEFPLYTGVLPQESRESNQSSIFEKERIDSSLSVQFSKSFSSILKILHLAEHQCLEFLMQVVEQRKSSAIPQSKTGSHDVSNKSEKMKVEQEQEQEQEYVNLEVQQQHKNPNRNANLNAKREKEIEKIGVGVGAGKSQAYRIPLIWYKIYQNATTMLWDKSFFLHNSFVEQGRANSYLFLKEKNLSILDIFFLSEKRVFSIPYLSEEKEKERIRDVSYRDIVPLYCKNAYERYAAMLSFVNKSSTLAIALVPKSVLTAATDRKEDRGSHIKSMHKKTKIEKEKEKETDENGKRDENEQKLWAQFVYNNFSSTFMPSSFQYLTYNAYSYWLCMENALISYRKHKWAKAQYGSLSEFFLESLRKKETLLNPNMKTLSSFSSLNLKRKELILKKWEDRQVYWQEKRSKALHLEVSFQSLSVIYLYPPQQIYTRKLLDVDLLIKAFSRKG